MPAKPLGSAKAKRHKKRKSRTEVSPDISSSSEDERPQLEAAVVTASKTDAMEIDSVANSVVEANNQQSQSQSQSQSKSPTSSSPNPSSPPPQSTTTNPPPSMSTSFQKFYMQRATEEFAEDLDAIRGADDFRDGALEMLIFALRQGVGVWGVEEMGRVVGG